MYRARRSQAGSEVQIYRLSVGYRTDRPLRDGKNGGMFMNGKLASGKVLTMQGGAPDK